MRITRQWMWLLVLVGCAGGTDTSPGSSPDWGEVVETEIQVGEMVFDARAAGPDDGELVLLLHGFPETSYEWHS